MTLAVETFLWKWHQTGRRRAVIYDWATAVLLDGVTTSYQGAVHFAADSVLQHLAEGRREFIFTTAMDLESLVKTVWDLLLPAASDVLQVSKHDYGAIFAWWRRRAAENKYLQRYLECARDNNYQALKTLWELSIPM